MAGHSKWANIKHRKGRQDAKRGKVFSVLIRELTVAAKLGNSCTAGILVEPPTRTFCSIAVGANSASFKDISIGVLQRSIKLEQRSSNFARVKSFSKCFGPSGVTEINGEFIELCVNVESSIFAFLQLL